LLTKMLTSRCYWLIAALYAYDLGIFDRFGLYIGGALNLLGFS